MTDFKDYYSILNIPPDADEQLIREAYIKLSSFMHPDKHPPERRSWAEEKQKELNEAYEVLKDPIKRKEYDEYYKSYQEFYNIFKDEEKKNTQNNTSKNDAETSPPYNQNKKDKPLGCIGEMFMWLTLAFLISITSKIIKSCSENTSIMPTNSSNSSIYNNTNATSGVIYPTSNSSNYTGDSSNDTTACFNYLNSQSYQLALQAGENAVKLHPKSAEAQMCLGFAYTYLGYYSSSISHLVMAEKFTNNKSELEEIYSFLSGDYNSLGDLNTALFYLDKELQVAKDLNDKEGESNALNGIAIIYQYRGNYDKALEYFNKSLKLASEPSTIANIYGGIASIYLIEGDNNKAIELSKKAIEFAKKADDFDKVAQLTINLAEAYVNSKNFSEAEHYLTQGLEMVQKLGNKEWEANAYVEFGKLYLAQNQEDLAKEYLTKAYNLFKAIGNNTNAQWVYETYLKK